MTKIHCDLTGLEGRFFLVELFDISTAAYKLSRCACCFFPSSHMAPNCPNILSSGVCNDSKCRLNHNIRTCDMCNYVARNIHEYNAHLQSRRHKRVLAGQVFQSLYCHVCECPVDSAGWNQHKRGKRHQELAETQQMSADIEPDLVLPAETHTFCNICQTSIAKHIWRGHLQGRMHLAKEKYAAYKTVLEDTEKEKNGITIEGDTDFGILEPAVSANGKAISLKILSTIPSAKIVLISVKLSADLGSQKRRVTSQ